MTVILYQNPVSPVVKYGVQSFDSQEISTLNETKTILVGEKHKQSFYSNLH